MATRNLTSLEKFRKLVQEKAVLHGDFTLASGERSPHYFDLKQVLTWPEGAFLAGKLVFELLKYEVAAVGGYGLGGHLITTAVVLTSELAGGYPLRGFFIEDGKDGCVLEGNVPLAGIRVALVDDVLTTGGTLKKAIECCRQKSLRVGKIIVLLDRGQGGFKELRQGGYDIAALLRVNVAGRVNKARGRLFERVNKARGRLYCLSRRAFFLTDFL